MSTPRGSPTLRAGKIILDLLFGLLIFATAGLAVYTAITPWLISHRVVGTASIPVRVGTGDDPEFEVTFRGAKPYPIAAATVAEAEGTLQLNTENWVPLAISNGVKVLVGLGLIWALGLLRSIVRSVHEGETFTEQNCGRMRRLGYVVFGLGFAVPAVQYLAASAILDRLPASDPALNPGPTFSAEVLLASLLILILAHVWSYGLDLKRDKALTV